MTGGTNIIVGTFVVYILAMLVIGWIAWRRTRSHSDYILGGRRIGPWVAALSAGASDMSGWLLLGLPGFAYAAGVESLWLAAGLLIGTYLNWRIVASRLRRYSEATGDALTIPAYLSRRFVDRKHLLRSISALFILLFFMFYTSSGLVAGGKLFETVFGFSYVWAVTAGTLAVMVYTFMGGFLAVSWTDLFQGLLMLAALLIVPVIAVQNYGGFSSVLSGITDKNPYLLDVFTNASGSPLGFIAVISLLGWGLGYFGQPHILARFKAIKYSRDIPVARRIAVSWTGLTLAGATMVGLVGIVAPADVMTSTDSEKIFMMLVDALFHPVIAGILLAAILAAIMSTADSQLLVSSSALAEDFYKAIFCPQASDAELMLAGRVAVVLIALAAFLLALTPGNKVLDLVAYAWAGFGAAFGPVIVISLYWSRMNWHGALAGVVTGGVTVVVWKQLDGGVLETYEIIPGVLLATAAVIIVSLITPPPARHVVDRHRQLFYSSSGSNSRSEPSSPV
jgi:sodium/proline symporter